MYQEIKNACKLCWSETLRIFGCMFLISLVIFIGYYTYKGGWNNTLHYPEESYKQLETEANRIFNLLKEHENFESEYKYIITKYSSDTNNLNFCIYGENKTSANVYITSLGSSDSDITIHRECKSFASHFIKDLVSLIVFPILIGGLSIIILLPMSLVIWFVAFIIHKITLLILRK